MALQIKPKFRQITNPNFITFFYFSSSSSNLDSNVNSNKSSSKKNNMRPKSSLSSLSSFFSSAKPLPPPPAPKPQNQHHHETYRKPRPPPSSGFSFVSSSEQPTVKLDSLEELRKSLFESRYRYPGRTVSPSPLSSSTTNDSTNDGGYKKADFSSTLREGMRHMGSLGVTGNVNHGVGSSSSPFFDNSRFNKDGLNHGSGSQRSQFLHKEHPEAPKLRKPPFPYYDDADGDAWEAAFNEYVKAEDPVDGFVAAPTTVGDDVNIEDKILVDTLLEFHSKGLYHSHTGFKKGVWKIVKARMRIMGHGRKGIGLIITRIRNLRTQWSAIHDLLRGHNRSGFRWDAEKKCVAAEHDVWDAYIKAHPEGAELRNKVFPYYDDLCIVWAKDRATVEDRKTLTNGSDNDEAHSEAAKFSNPPFPVYNDSDALDDVTGEYNVLPGAMSDKDMNQRKEGGNSIVPDGLKTKSRDNKSPRECRVWTIKEDKMLVNTLLEFQSKGIYCADYGFKKGALNEMKLRMKMTGCGRKGFQRVNYRLRKLKTEWYTIHDLLTGKSSSCFRWDTKNKCLKAENDVWDAYVQAHPEAAKLRNRSFPYYDDLCIVWAEDKVTIEDAKMADDFEELDNDEACHCPEAAKLKNPTFPLYNDIHGKFNKDVTGEYNTLPDAMFDKDRSHRKEEGRSIVPNGFKAESREYRGPAKNRYWTITEDNMLINTLLELHSKGIYCADYGFKRGAVQEMKMRMKMKGYGLKGSQCRFRNRLYRLRAEWSAIHDLLTGKNSSYFGWDTEKNCLTAEDDVWDAYVQVHPEAAKLRNVSFPYYDDLCIVWAKNRGIGNHANSPTTTEDFEEPNRDKSADDIALSTCVSHRKRTRNEPADYFVEAREGALKSFSEKIEKSLDITEKQMKINGELEKIEDLPTLARYKVGYMIASDVSKLNLFFSLPEEQRKDWVTALLEGEF